MHIQDQVQQHIKKLSEIREERDNRVPQLLTSTAMEIWFDSDMKDL